MKGLLAKPLSRYARDALSPFRRTQSQVRKLLGASGVSSTHLRWHYDDLRTGWSYSPVEVRPFVADCHLQAWRLYVCDFMGSVPCLLASETPTKQVRSDPRMILPVGATCLGVSELIDPLAAC